MKWGWKVISSLSNQHLNNIIYYIYRCKKSNPRLYYKWKRSGIVNEIEDEIAYRENNSILIEDPIVMDRNYLIY